MSINQDNLNAILAIVNKLADANRGLAEINDNGKNWVKIPDSDAIFPHIATEVADFVAAQNAAFKTFLEAQVTTLEAEYNSYTITTPEGE